MSNVGTEVAALPWLTVQNLRRRYAEIFGEPTRATNRTWLTKRIAWRLQSLAEGDLSERARTRAVELARDADLGLFESAFESGRDDHAPPDVHLNGAEAGAAATSAGVCRLVLTHLPTWNDPAVARRDAATTFDGEIALARSGDTYEV